MKKNRKLMIEQCIMFQVSNYLPKANNRNTRKGAKPAEN